MLYTIPDLYFLRLKKVTLLSASVACPVPMSQFKWRGDTYLASTNSMKSVSMFGSKNSLISGLDEDSSLCISLTVCPMMTLSIHGTFVISYSLVFRMSLTSPGARAASWCVFRNIFLSNTLIFSISDDEIDVHIGAVYVITGRMTARYSVRRTLWLILLRENSISRSTHQFSVFESECSEIRKAHNVLKVRKLYKNITSPRNAYCTQSAQLLLSLNIRNVHKYTQRTQCT